MDHSFFELSCPHQKGAHHGHNPCARQTNPVYQVYIHLQVADYAGEHPGQDVSNEVLVTRHRFIFGWDTGEQLCLLLESNCLGQNDESGEQRESNKDCVRCLLGEEKVIEQVG